MKRSGVRALLVVALLGAAQSEGWAPARADYAWSFPRDHWAHPALKTEWWYLTGNLADSASPGRHFGYQLTFFRIGVLDHRPAPGANWVPQMIMMGHAAVTDLGEHRHVFSDVFYRALDTLAGFGSPGDSLIAWARAPAGTSGRWTLRWTGDGFAFDMTDQRRGIAFALTATPAKPLVLQGPNGLSRKGPAPGAASQYYSYTRLDTRGTLRTGARDYAVRGTSWMDQEVGSNQLARDQVGWDWFGLQLDDGRELMMYRLRDSVGTVTWASGTIVPATGAPRYLPDSAFSVVGTAAWRSDSTAAVYPARWTIRVPDAQLVLDVVPRIADQENRSALPRGLFYWEGAVEVRIGGRVAGRGYAELTGYGKGIRPAL